MKGCHLYMKGVNGWGFFYRLEDAIVYYTLYSVYARELDLCVVSFSIMFNHTHCMVLDEPMSKITLFQRKLGVSTAHKYNREYGRKGQLWHHSYGYAFKVSPKKILGTIAYVANNPVAGKLNSRAFENRWTMLAYYNCDHPFSREIDKRKCSRSMLRAISLVNLKFKAGEYLDYHSIRRIFAKLSSKEKAQITDYIVSKYNFLDYEALIGLFGSFEKAVLAIDSMAGSEYDIEDDKGNHSCYRKMLLFLKNAFPGKTRINVEKLTQEQILRFKSMVSGLSANSDEQIRKFLHLKQ